MDEFNQYSVPEQVPSKKLKLCSKDVVAVAGLCLLSVLFSSFALWGGFRAGYSIVSFLLFAAMTVYLYSKKRQIGLFSWLCGILACILPSVFVMTSNGMVRFLSFLVETVLQCVWFASLSGKKIEAGELGLLKSVVRWLTRCTFGNMPRSMEAVCTVKSRKKQGFGKVLLGVLFSLPVLLIVVPLLISSDEAFSGMVSRFTDSIGELVPKVIVGLFITPALISFFLFMKKVDEPEGEAKNRKGLENTIVISFLSVLSLCYLLYLFSQLAYFFSAFRGFLPEDYTFNVATYARRGFFEMSVIAAINFTIIYGALLLSRKNAGKSCLAVRFLSLFISLFTLLIIATALSKMYLYIDSFGLTVLRINTSAFMVFLAIVFVALILRLFAKKVRVLKVALVTAACILAVLGVMNVNRVTAEYNYTAYKAGNLESIDVENLAMLGDEGVPYLLKLTNDKDHTVAEMASTYVKSKIRYIYYDVSVESGKMIVEKRSHTGIADYSVVRSEAYRLLDDYIGNHDGYSFK